MRYGEYIVTGIVIIKGTFFFFFGKRPVKYFHFKIPGLLEPLKIMASSSASSLTDSLSVGECTLSGPADLHIMPCFQVFPYLVYFNIYI